MRCHDVFAEIGALEAFWLQIHSELAYLHGSPRLTSREDVRSAADDAFVFLQQCSDEHFLDFVEFVFRVDAYFRVLDQGRLVQDFNEFLSFEDLPYFLTGFTTVKEKVIEFGREYDTERTTSYPQVIRKDSQLVHSTAIAPTLELLADPAFSAANKELLEALEDYRRQDYGDCLTKCGSALESVLKVICTKRGWPHQQTDTAAPLLKTVIAKSGLDAFFEQPLVLVATIRNKLSTAHGSGTTERDVSGAKAEYAINATAAAILLLVKQTL